MSTTRAVPPADQPMDVQSLAHPDGSASQGMGLGHELDPHTTAFVAVDVQRMFTDLLAVPVFPPLERVRSNIRACLDQARAAGATVILVRTVIASDEHSRGTRTWPEFMRNNLAPGAPGTEFDPCTGVSSGDLQVVKQRYSAFHGTALDSVLKERGITTVVLCGITTNVCVQSTARDAWQLDYEAITLSDCCAEIGEGEHEASLAYTARNFGTVCTSAEATAGLRTAAARSSS